MNVLNFCVKSFHFSEAKVKNGPDIANFLARICIEEKEIRISFKESIVADMIDKFKI